MLNKSRSKNISKSQKGFSLIELVVVIAIMAVLAGIVTPQFISQVSKKRAQACQVARENIVSVVERKIINGDLIIVDGSGNLDVTAITNYVISGDYEIKDNKCPDSGNFTVRIVDSTTGKIGIACSHSGHDEIFFFVNALKARNDAFLADTPVPTPSASPTPTITVTPTATPTEEPTTTPPPGAWPEPDDYDKWGTTTPRNDTVCQIHPSGIFVDSERTGAKYVIIRDYDLHYWQSLTGPEGMGANGTWDVVVPLGNQIQESALTYWDNNNKTQYNNVGYGDYVIIDGRCFVMWVHSDAYGYVNKINLSTMSPKTIQGQWYEVPMP